MKCIENTQVRNCRTLPKPQDLYIPIPMLFLELDLNFTLIQASQWRYFRTVIIDSIRCSLNTDRKLKRVYKSITVT